MVAKLIVHGDTREEALARLDVALAQTHIVGLQTNVQFLRHVVQSRSFAQADLDTALIPREAAALALKNAGIDASPARHHPEYAADYWAVFFTDPDGLRLEITNYRAERRARHDHWED